MYGLLLHNHGAHVVATASLPSKGIRLEVSATTSLTTDSGACNYLFTNFLCINCGVAEWLSEIGKCGTPTAWVQCPIRVCMVYLVQKAAIQHWRPSRAREAENYVNVPSWFST